MPTPITSPAAALARRLFGYVSGRGVLGLLVAGLLLGACGTDLTVKEDDLYDDSEGTAKGKIFGEEGFVLFGGSSKKLPGAEEGGGGIGVNSFLWHASLDTISFMPVSSADPFGGVIITDWHSTTGAANERFKMNVYILGRALRADGVRVSVFRQVLNANGQWQDTAVPEGAAAKIEDSILTRARQIRNQALLQE